MTGMDFQADAVAIGGGLTDFLQQTLALRPEALA